MLKKAHSFHGLRARLDSKRIYVRPGKVEDFLLKKGSGLLGKIFNIKIFRPHKGLVFGRDFGEKAQPLGAKEIGLLQSGKRKAK